MRAIFTLKLGLSNLGEKKNTGYPVKFELETHRFHIYVHSAIFGSFVPIILQFFVFYLVTLLKHQCNISALPSAKISVWL